MHDALADALYQLSAHDDATSALAAAREAGSLMAAALAENLSGDERNAYDAPRAFEVFIRGGGNPALYDAVSTALASLIEDPRVDALLDIGAGDGMALLPALQRARRVPRSVDVVEPSSGLLDRLRPQLPAGDAWPLTLQDWLSRITPARHWDLAQSTFALQSIAPDERLDALTRLRAHVSRLAIVEFDVPVFDSESDRLASMAHRYENAARDYGNDAPLVAGGFLAPMLLGQLRTTTPSNFEQPIAAWRKELEYAGYRVQSFTHLYDYSWAPAWLIVADA
ncbi:hypothetical protein SAMN02800694_2826 [Luteibacter sp. UNCMF331Sha3.1]|uniref:class I SAM-dependent methyltransferase n=1 Tax=Luteibacter sp. UNCMF331Sha3.1 TaxID=1502760 RepID=UPI0008BF50FB|nr:class I SAM-dependent methyltransferase [Luteibacter sp. UNCMF331Sha3.1]SEN11895.1 hypothetical protein SAMN02800694_2826 [Luteibacter sp. UNCMF331Sha3.1]